MRRYLLFFPHLIVVVGRYHPHCAFCRGLRLHRFGLGGIGNEVIPSRSVRIVFVHERRLSVCRPVRPFHRAFAIKQDIAIAAIDGDSWQIVRRAPIERLGEHPASVAVDRDLRGVRKSHALQLRVRQLIYAVLRDLDFHPSARSEGGMCGIRPRRLCVNGAEEETEEREYVKNKLHLYWVMSFELRVNS